MPGSFKWKLNSLQKQAFKSPWYLLESVIASAKDYSESKRLLYVVCTRAIKSLSWMDMESDEKPLFYNNDSWIKGFRLFSAKKDLKMELDCNSKELRDFSSSPPLFQQDSLGIEKKSGNSAINLGTLSELSVTGLATITQCPRKFYFKNILKLEVDTEIVSASGSIKEYKQREEGTLLASSLERGSRIHASIESFFKNEKLPAKAEEEISWIIKELSVYKHTHEIISEIPLKFSLFGQTITGIPDMILLPKDPKEVLTIIDFKTGARSKRKEWPYWFQLYLYGYASYHLNYVQEENDQLSLVLAYLDQKEMVIQKIGRPQLENALFKEWKKVANLNQANRKHCEICQFGNICHF